MVHQLTSEANEPKDGDLLLEHIIIRCHVEKKLECRHNKECSVDVGSGCPVCVIENGLGAVALTTMEGELCGTEIVGRGAVIGLARLGRDFPITTLTFSAINDTQMLFFRYEEFIMAMDEDFTIHRLLFNQLQERFLLVVRQYLNTHNSADDAVASMLHLLADTMDGTATKSGIRLPILHEQIAMLTGKSVPSTNRALLRLRREGKVWLQRGMVIMQDRLENHDSKRWPTLKEDTDKAC